MQRLYYLALLLVFFSLPSGATERVINGVEVPSGMFPEVVKIQSNNAHCTGTLVGPQVLLTAAHCVHQSAIATFEADGKTYSGKAIRHPLYPDQDLDIAVILLDTAVPMEPASVGGPATIDEKVFMLGYGCSTVGGTGGVDGLLRMGESQVIDFNKSDFVTRRPDGAALCFGDSGGPAYVKVADRYAVAGISSKGDIKETSYFFNVQSSEAQQFLTDVANENKVEICGVNTICGKLSSTAPQFKKTNVEVSVQAGTERSVFLPTLLTVPTADLKWELLDAEPWITLEKDNQLRIQPDAKLTGSFTSVILARTPKGSDAVTLTVNVQPDVAAPPQCQLEAKPAFVRLGESLSLILSSTGETSDATIDGNDVSPNGGSITLTPAASGVFVGVAIVNGPGGKAHCTARYGVK